MKDSESLRQTEARPLEGNTPSGKRLWLLLAGVFLISSGLLAYEITITRVLSVILSYHYVFAVISIALLGLGMGAILDHMLKKRLAGVDRFGSLALLTSILAISIPLSVLIMASIANSQELGSHTSLYLLITFVPFFVAGVIFAELFASFSKFSSRVYGADLLGASAGAVGAVVAINYFGGVKAMAAVTSLIVMAAVFYLGGLGSRRTSHYLTVTIGLLLAFSLLGTYALGTRLAEISIGSRDKEMANVIFNPDSPGRIIDSRWNAFGRTDLVESKNDPSQMAIFTDGTAGATMYRFNGDLANPDPAVENLQTSFAGYLALSSIPQGGKKSALIIGPGGGRDVLLAQMAGVSQITAVEVNQATVDIVRQYSQYNGGIYEAPNVSVVVDEGRNFLRRQKEKYDVIMLSIPLTKTGRSLEGFALTENFLFTTDSIRDYIDHLSDTGRLVVVAHDQPETIKLLSLSLEALKQRGIDNKQAMKQIAVIGNHMFPAFVLAKAPLTSAESISLHESIHELGFDPAMSYLPDIQVSQNISHTNQTSYNQCSSLNTLLLAASQGRVNFSELNSQASASGMDIRPVSDDNPFFYKFEVGLPAPVSLVLWLSSAALAITAGIFYVRRKNIGDQTKHRKDRARLNSRLFRLILLFSMLGIGFMLVEVSIFQRLTLFLGQPVLSLAVMLASLLLGAGLGSLSSGRVAPEKITRALAFISPVIVVFLLFYAFVLPQILNQLLGLVLNLRLLTAVLALLPLGFVMGFPFPLGMRLLNVQNLEDSIPWMWGINGIASVVGSALTIAIAVSFGFTAALILGAVCYTVVFFTFWERGNRLSPKEQGNS